MSATRSGTPAATAPRGRPLASVVALVLRLLVVALAVVTVRDLVVTQGWASGTSWTASVAGSLDGAGSGAGGVVAGVVLVALGVLVLLLGLLPARRTHLRSSVDALDLWITPAALAALARAVADRSAGVLEARTARAGRRRVRVAVRAHGDAAAVGREAQAAVDRDVSAMTPARVVVTSTSKELPR